MHLFPHHYFQEIFKILIPVSQICLIINGKYDISAKFIES